MIWLALLAFAYVCLLPLWLAWWRRRPLHRKYIEPVLTRQGYRLVSIRVPPWFDRGPFDPPAFLSSGLISRLPMLNAEYLTWRIAEAVDAQGQPVTVWFQLQFSTHILVEIKSMRVQP